MNTVKHVQTPANNTSPFNKPLLRFIWNNERYHFSEMPTTPEQVKHYFQAHKNDGPVCACFHKKTPIDNIFWSFVGRTFVAEITDINGDEIRFKANDCIHYVRWDGHDYVDLLSNGHLSFPFLSEQAIEKRKKRAQRKKRRKLRREARKRWDRQLREFAASAPLEVADDWVSHPFD